MVVWWLGSRLRELGRVQVRLELLGMIWSPRRIGNKKNSPIFWTRSSSGPWQIAGAAWSAEISSRRPWSLPESSIVETQEPKTKVDPAGKMVMILGSIELSITNSPKASTWRASCRCLMTDNMLQGYSERCLVGFNEDWNGWWTQETTSYTSSGRLDGVIPYI